MDYLRDAWSPSFPLAVLLATLSLREWRAVLANDARGELLAVAGSGDRDLVRSFVLGLPGVADEVKSA
jgi:hypothetical protein